MSDEPVVQGKDIKIEDLVPLRERNINFEKNRGFSKIFASIKAIGLIEPLCVYKDNGKYNILDGFLRYQACQKLGVGEVPCLIFRDKEAYTFNNKVNRLSAVQEMRMLKMALKTVDETTVAEVFGMKNIRYRLGSNIIRHLHSSVVKTLDANLMSRGCAMELALVKHERQLQILKEMERTGDFSVSFARALVLKTPDGQRNPEIKTKTWTQDPVKKTEMVAKLQEVEKRHDFYSNLYRQYSTDLLKLCIYARKLISNDKIRECLKGKYPAVLEQFEKIILETEGNLTPNA
jgi:hypothetical protein